MEIKVSDEIVAAFHQMWDLFPGAARLVGKDRVIIAANEKAVAAGHAPGVRCSTLPSATNHRGCLAQRSLAAREGMADNPSGKSIRGWVPVKGRDDLFVHFSLAVPDPSFKE